MRIFNILSKQIALNIVFSVYRILKLYIIACTPGYSCSKTEHVVGFQSQIYGTFPTKHIF